MGFKDASSLQAKVLPELLNSARNKVLVSYPGSGMTTALAICILHHVKVNINRPQVLVVCATFEAALQFYQTLKNIAVLMDVTFDLVISSFGGECLSG